MAGEVKRWTPIEGYLWIDDEAGEYVRHDDHVAECQRLREALRNAAEGLDMALNRFRKMGIMEEADRYFPYLHAVDAALAEPAPARTEKITKAEREMYGCEG